MAIVNNIPESDPARAGFQPGAQKVQMESDEDFATRTRGMADTELKAAVDFRNIQKRANEVKPEIKEPAQGDPDAHPVYSIQRLVRDLEMAISKTVSYKNSDVEKTLVRLKDEVHGVINALHGPVKASAES